MLNTDNFDKVEITSVEDLRNWLINNHNQDKGVWLVTLCKNCFGYCSFVKKKNSYSESV